MKHRNDLLVPYEYLYSFMAAFKYEPNNKFKEWGIPKFKNTIHTLIVTNTNKYLSKELIALKEETIELPTYRALNQRNMWKDFIEFFSHNLDEVSLEFLKAFDIIKTKKLRIPLEALIHTGADPDEIAILFSEISDGFSVDDIEYYMKYFYAIHDMEKDDLYSYAENIPEQSELLLKEQAMEGDLDHVRYVLNLSCDLTDLNMMEQVTQDSFFNYRSNLKTDITSNIKMYSDIFFKSSDRLQKLREKSAGDKTLPFRLNIEIDSTPIDVIEDIMDFKPNPGSNPDTIGIIDE
jgi:hypothetical protein